MSVTVTLEDEAQTKCHVLLYEIENAADVRQLIMKGQVEASLIKPEMVSGIIFICLPANAIIHTSKSRCSHSHTCSHSHMHSRMRTLSHSLFVTLPDIFTCIHRRIVLNKVFELDIYM